MYVQKECVTKYNVQYSTHAHTHTCKLITTTKYVCLCLTTLTEVFPCFFLSCKANARVKPARTGHGPHSS